MRKFLYASEHWLNWFKQGSLEIPIDLRPASTRTEHIVLNIKN